MKLKNITLKTIVMAILVIVMSVFVMGFVKHPVSSAQNARCNVDAWQEVPTDSLWNKAMVLLMESNDPYSSLECLDTILNRLNGKKLLMHEDSNLYTVTANNIGYIYMHYHHDYLKAWKYIEQAKRHSTSVMLTKTVESNAEHLYHIVLVIALSVCLLVVLILTVLLFKTVRKLKERNWALYMKTQEILAHDADDANTEKKANEKYVGSTLNDDEKLKLKQKIKEIMNSSDEVWSEEFSLMRLAELCDSNYKNISQVVNECYDCSFSIMLSEYRIKEACKRIDNQEEYGRYTIEGISESVGFKSRGGFARAFKRVVGLSPSEYMKIARERQKDGA